MQQEAEWSADDQQDHRQSERAETSGAGRGDAPPDREQREADQRERDQLPDILKMLQQQQLCGGPDETEPENGEKTLAERSLGVSGAGQACSTGDCSAGWVAARARGRMSHAPRRSPPFRIST